MKANRSRLVLAGSIAVSVLLGCIANAQITYVDADYNVNTFLAPSAGGGTVATNGTDSVDGIWRVRGGFGLGVSDTTLPAGVIATGGSGTVYESTGNSSPSDDVPRVFTSVTNLTFNTYDVYLYFWSDQSASPWRVRAGLTDDVNPLSLYIGGATPSGTPTPVQINTDSSGRLFFQVNLGQVTGTSIDVFVEDAPATSNNERTWYDGIGYSVIPEPSTFALVGMGVAAMVVFRRRNS
jgi:hypothetical protein